MSGTMYLLVPIKWLPLMLWRPGIEAAISKHAFPSSWTEEFGATFVMIKTNTNATRSRTLAEIRMSATARQEFLISFRVSTRWHNFILFGLNCAVQYYNLKCIDYPGLVSFFFLFPFSPTACTTCVNGLPTCCYRSRTLISHVDFRLGFTWHESTNGNNQWTSNCSTVPHN